MASVSAEEKYGYEDSRFKKAVDANFHCSICFNVLKEPMMCRNNEHVFCRGCITEHLTVNSHTCPECNEDLTVETLRRGPRMVINYLSELKIRCDYSSRGCQEFIRLEELDSHVQNCGFAPVKCSNEECGIVVNKLELVHHESTVCEYRKVKCHNCVKIDQDMEEIKEKMKGLASKDDVNALMVQMFQKLSFLENIIQATSAINHASTAFMEDILVAGGWDTNGSALKSVERFSWKNNRWQGVSSMEIGRAGATSFVYENQVFVAGGYNGGDEIEVLNFDSSPRLRQWRKFTATLPNICERLFSVVYQNRAILFIKRNDYETDETIDASIELTLTEPYTCKHLCKMPDPRRENYRVVAFGHKVMIFGGKSDDKILNSVLEFDLTTNDFKDMSPLPHALQEMATVRWGDQAILIGGLDNIGKSKKVYMYNSISGNTIELPPMKEERAGCCAIITGNTIVVMGGRTKKTRVRSVEAFTLGEYSWRSLPDMNDIRSLPTATVLTTKHFP